MYQFTVNELNVLSLAKNGLLIEGTADYEFAQEVFLGDVPPLTPLGQTRISQFEALLSVNELKPHAAFYDLAAEFASKGGPENDNVIAWLNGAAGVNRGTSFAANFIKEYTAAQIFGRTHKVVDEVNLQNASNAIADLVYRDLVVDLSTSGKLLSIEQIGTRDALGALGSLEKDGFPNDPALWSGNLLFPGLGVTKFLEENLLGEDNNTYELVAAIYSVQQAGYFTGFGSSVESFWTLWSNSSSIGQAKAQVDSFLERAYGQITDMGTTYLGLTASFIGLKEHADEFHGTSGVDLIHGGGGADTLFGSQSGLGNATGTDFFDGGTGYDTANFTQAFFKNEIYATDVVVSHVQDAAVSSSASVLNGENGGGTTILFDVENLILGNNSNTVFVREISNLERIDAGGNPEDGDTVDFHLWESTGITLNLDTGVLAGTGVGGNSLTLLNFEHVIGSDFNDTIIGNDSDNNIQGGGGADTLDGGIGQDIIYFDADDTSVQGGGGYDVGYFGEQVSDGAEVNPTYTWAPSENIAIVNLEQMGLEVFVGGNKNDVITAGGKSSSIVVGGKGNDVIFIEKNGAPVVVWGGEGADTVTIETSSGRAGILVVQIDNVTEENIKFLDFSMMGLGPSFQWGQIDAVIINPDVSDSFFVEQNDIAYQISVDETENAVERHYTDTNGDYVTEQYGSIDYLGFSQTDDPNPSVGDFIQQVEYYQQDFIRGYSGSVYAPTYDRTTLRIVEHMDIAGKTYVCMLGDDDGHIYSNEPLAANLGLGGSGWDYESDYEYDLSSADFVSQWTTEDGSYGSREHFFYEDGNAPLTDHFSWFVVGGSFVGSSLFSNYTSSIPFANFAIASNTSSASIESAGIAFSLPDSSTGAPRGGSYEYSTGQVNLGASDGTIRVAEFNLTTDVVVIDGNPINGTNLPDGVTIAEFNGSVAINYRGDNNIVLRGISLADWETSVQAQVLGTFSDDVLDGSAGSDVIVGGSGNDVVYAGTGSDIIYLGDGDDSLINSRGSKDVFGGNGNDIISVFDSSYVDGGAGDDYIFGKLTKGGDHIFTGGEGADTFEFAYAGTKEADQIITDFESGIDTLIISAQTLSGIDLQNLPSDFSLNEVGGDLVISYGTNDLHSVTLENLTISEFLVETATPGTAVNGTSAGDSMGLGYVDADGNVITDGADVILALDGDDVVNSGTGNDLIYLGDGNDTLTLTRGSKTVFGGEGDDTISVMDNSIANGGAGDDVLFGKLIKGGDHIFTGDAGADTFEFAYAASKEADQIITDFEVGTDQLIVDGETLSGIALTSLPSTYSVSELNGDLIIAYGTNDMHSITLQNTTSSDFFV